MKRKNILFLCVLMAAILLFGCGDQKQQGAADQNQEPQTEEIVNYDELSLNELELLGYDGDVEAQYRMGLIYEYGTREQPQDFAQAKGWYERAAKKQDIRALTALGYLYLNGCGVDASLDQAAAYFTQGFWM